MEIMLSFLFITIFQRFEIFDLFVTREIFHDPVPLVLQNIFYFGAAIHHLFVSDPT
jgi:hypothetical protein